MRPSYHVACEFCLYIGGRRVCINKAVRLAHGLPIAYEQHNCFLASGSNGALRGRVRNNDFS